MDWNLLITALAGLGGVAVGGFVTWKIQERQLQHADETRFHEHKKDIYADMMSMANIGTSKLVTGNPAPDELIEFLRKLEQVKMVAGTNVVNKANMVFTVVNDLRNAFVNKLPANETKAIEVKYAAAAVAFLNAARKELKVSDTGL